jgi:hypothetical protein
VLPRCVVHRRAWASQEKIARPDQRVFAFEDGVSPEDIGQVRSAV